MIPFSDRPSPKAAPLSIWEWLHRANERARPDDLTEAEYAVLASAAPCDAARPPASSCPQCEITRREQRAILLGFYLRSRDEPDAWAEVRRCLEAEAVSRDFRRLVARMIEGNILHANGRVPTGLDRADTMARRAIYVDLLERYYPDLGNPGHKRLAERLVALDLYLDYHDVTAFPELVYWQGGEFTEERVKELAPQLKEAFTKKLAPFEKQVKSVCDHHRGSNKAAKGIGAEVLSAATAARVIPEE